MLNKHLKFELLIKKLYKYLSDDMAIRNNRIVNNLAIMNNFP